MLQQDMTGFVQKTLDAGQPESVGVITDFVDRGLTEFIKVVIDEVRHPPAFIDSTISNLMHSTAASPG